MSSDQTHVVVGASLTGARAAETLRTEGFDGCVLLIDAEDERPYERPPLSKDYLRGEAGLARAWDRVVLRGDPVAREFIAFWLVDNRVVAGMNVNVWGVMDAIKLLIRERVPVDAGTLSDLDVTLEELGHVAKGGVA
jgi:hypothetical protein